MNFIIDTVGDLIIKDAGNSEPLEIKVSLNPKLVNVYLKSQNISVLHLTDCENLKTIRVENNSLPLKILISGNNIPPTHNMIVFQISNSIISDLSITNMNIYTIMMNSTKILKGKVGFLKCNRLIVNQKESDLDNIKNVESFLNIVIHSSFIEKLKVQNTDIKYFHFNDNTFNKIEFTKIKSNEILFTGLKGYSKKYSSKSINSLNENPKIYFQDVIVEDRHELSDWNPINLQDKKYILSYKDIKFSKHSLIKLNTNDNSKINIDLEIDSISCPNSFKIQGIGSSVNTSIKVNFQSLSDGLLILETIKMNTLELTGINNKLSTIFDSCKIIELTFLNFQNYSSLKFLNCHKFNKVSILSSDLNNIIFRPFNYDSITLNSDSYISGINVIGSKIIEFDNNNLSTEQIQEYYRQLKQSAKNSNNKFLELEYKAKEMAHYKPSKCGDKVSHWVNSLSDHGTNWVKPLVYLVFWNLVIWLLISYNLYGKQFDIAKNGDRFWSLLMELSFGLWIILNPVSRMSEFAAYLDYDQPVHSFVPFLFFSSKLLNGILIYQMISAFRKWVGKD